MVPASFPPNILSLLGYFSIWRAAFVLTILFISLTCCLWQLTQVWNFLICSYHLLTVLTIFYSHLNHLPSCSDKVKWKILMTLPNNLCSTEKDSTYLFSLKWIFNPAQEWYFNNNVTTWIPTMIEWWLYYSSGFVFAKICENLTFSEDHIWTIPFPLIESLHKTDINELLHLVGLIIKVVIIRTVFLSISRCWFLLSIH